MILSYSCVRKSARITYVSVSGLQMYYEIHGSGHPLLVLHGAYMTIEAMSDLITRLAETRQVIAVEFQGHGRTGDIDRPITVPNLASDVIALMNALGIERADVFGYSLGSAAALELAITSPERVNKLVIVSSTYNSEGWYPAVLETIGNITPEMFAGSPIEEAYQRLSPNPDAFPTLVAKLTEVGIEVQSWTDDTIQDIASPMLVIVGDSDNVRPEHAFDLFCLRGGGVPGDLTGLPAAQLAVIPGATHISIIYRAQILAMLINEFLDPTSSAW
jgi:pimeloyl-ACP methyl ester carboxylesterase